MRTALLACLLLASPAFADVKAGVDAWQRGDYRKAVDEWRPLAVAGDADAQFNLGQAYKLGRGVPVDPQMAESWFAKAAKQGHPQAEDNYGLALFQSGRRPEALPWLAKSTARDEPRTELVLGTMLFNGDGVPRDYVRAYAMMTRAAAPRPGSQGLQSARETLAQMDDYISPTEREQGVAMAQQIALTAASAPAATGPNRVAETALTPAAAPSPVATRPMPARTTPPRVATRPAPVPTPAPAPIRTTEVPPSRIKPDHPSAAPGPHAAKPVAPAPAATGGTWRIQLGAFRSRANAETLWNRVRGRLPGAQPAYTAVGAVTRLQATGFVGKAAAQAGCAKVGGGCIVVAP